MNDHPLGLDCDALGECSHWQHRTDPEEWQRAMAEARRHQTALYSLHLLYIYDYEWKALNRHPLVQAGSGIFTIWQAIGWASRELVA